jgi:mRNA-degrading endonuclease RelE of RelBE toxin-antitoxin system
MIVFKFTNFAEKELRCLDNSVQTRVLKKLNILKDPKILELNLKVVVNLMPATHRLRVGNHRLLIEYNRSKNVCLILSVGHRNRIYKDL